MATVDCEASVQAAAPNLSPHQVTKLLVEVMESYEEISLNKSIADVPSALKSAIAERVSRMERDAIIEKRNRVLNLKVRMRHLQRIRSLDDEELPRYLEAMLVGEYGQSKFKGGIESSANAINRHANIIFSHGVEVRGLPRKEAIKFLRKSSNGEMLMRESYEPGSTGNDTARIIAEAMEEANEYLRKLANKNGADIARIPGYLVKQSHNSAKIMRTGKEKWSEDIIDLLDHERTFGADHLTMSRQQKISFLQRSFDSVISGRLDDTIKDLSEEPKFKGPGNVGKQLSHRRSLHFADGAAAWSYMSQYGNPDIGHSFFGGTDLMSKSIGAMIHLGPNPEYMMKEITKRVLDTRLRGNPLQNKVNANYLDRLYKEVTGGASILPPWNADGYYLARSANWLRNVSSSALLGGVTLASLSDLGTSAVRLADIGVPFMQAHQSVVTGLFKGRRLNDPQVREVADSMAVGIDSLISGVQSRWLGNDGIDGQGAFLVTNIMRVTGMNWLNDTMKSSVGLTVSNLMAKNISKSFDNLHPGLRSELSAYGVTAADWANLAEGVADVKGTRYINLNNVSNVETRQRVQEFIGGFADSAVLTPGARTMAMIRGSGDRGNPMTEIQMLFFHLKSFSIAYWNEILSRSFSKGEGVRFGYAANLILSMSVYGYISSTIKDLAKGKEPREPSMAAWFDAMATAGGAGFYGDLLIGMLKEGRMGEGLLEAIGGPVLGSLIRTPKILGELVEGDWDQAAQKTFRVGKSFFPGANIFYARTTLDYLFFWQMAEYIRPGWAQNFERRVKEETGQEFMDTGIPPFVSPTEAVTRGPFN
tara:strand:- start:1690 stop:4146 length:2457 start_codon:yes stop_codon:yes gene_type:complete